MSQYFEKHALIQSDGIWGDRRFEYSAGKLIYIGRHMAHKAATSDSAWYIWKCTHDGDDLTRIEGALRGAWEDNDTLGWAA